MSHFISEEFLLPFLLRNEGVSSSMIIATCFWKSTELSWTSSLTDFGA